MTSPNEIAVVGLAVTFAGSSGPAEFWKSVLESRVCLSDVPPERISSRFFSDEAPHASRLRTRRGGFLESPLSVDPTRYGIMPIRAAAMDPDHLVALKLSDDALADAGISESRRARRLRGGVIFGRSNVSGPGRLRLEQTLRGTLDLRGILGRYAPELRAGDVEDIVERYRSHYRTRAGRGDAEALIPNLVASRVARRYAFDGPAYTVDAACASSLIAVEQACDALAAHRADIMLCGGVHLWQDESLWWAFENLGAMSRSGAPKPFDKASDGLVLGEGAAVFVLKRGEDARRDGDCPYGLIVGWGSSSDDSSEGILAPTRAGQLRALEMAWRASGRDPAEIGYLEAHGTGTPIGDETELATIQAFFGKHGGEGPPPGIGAVKGLIGHTLAAAGAAGLAKVLLSLRHGAKPPIGNLVEARAELCETRFRPYLLPQPWADGQRLAAVSAFGFGGVNAHLVVRGADEGPSRPRNAARRTQRFAAATASSLASSLRRGEVGGTGSCRAALLTADEKKRQLVASIAEPGRSARRSRAGYSMSFDSLIRAGGKIAFLFPGLDAIRKPGPASSQSDGDAPEVRGVAVVVEGIRICRALMAAGIEPDIMAGHSIGEWAAMGAAGMVEEQVAERILAQIDDGYFKFPSVSYLVATCRADVAERIARDCAGVEVSHDNCSTQTILCAPEEPLARAAERLRQAGILCWKLPFATGFHTSYMESGIERHRETAHNLTVQRPNIPIWSATTVSEFPTQADDIKRLLIDQVLHRVRFRELVERLYRDANVRAFVQMGSGGLAGFVEDTLKGMPFLSVSTADGGSELADQIEWTKAILWTEGHVAAASDSPPFVERSWLGQTRLELGVPAFADALASDSGADRARLRPSAEAADSSTTIDSLERSATPVDTMAWEASLTAYPELSDHAFVRQPAGWPNVSDTDPVMPLSGVLEIVVSVFERWFEGRAGEVRELSARKWMRVVPPQRFETSVALAPDAVGYRVTLGDYAEGLVVSAKDQSGEDEVPWSIPARARHSPMQPHEVYANKWLFHGPRYQTMLAVDSVWSDGIAGRVRYDGTHGAALDGAAQFVGLWVMLNAESDKLTVPVRVKSVTFGPVTPAPGDVVRCVVHIVRVTGVMVTADMQLSVDGRVWLTVRGWEDVRLKLDERTWNFMRWPERYAASRRISAGIVLEERVYRVPAIEEYVLRQFFGEAERDALSPGGKVDWDEVSRRVAAKDAARDFLWSSGAREIFPIEVSCTPAGEQRYELLWQERHLCVTLVDVAGFRAAVCGTAPWPEAGFVPDGTDSKAQSQERDSVVAARQGDAGVADLGVGTLWWRRHERDVRSTSHA